MAWVTRDQMKLWKLLLVILSFVAFGYAQADTVYDAPYYTPGIKGDHSSIEEAIVAVEAWVRRGCPSCTFMTTYNASGWAPATVWYNNGRPPYVGGNGQPIYATSYTIDMHKNAGGGLGCNGGNGGKGWASAPFGGSGDESIEGRRMCPGTPMMGDPINTSTGNKFQQETDSRVSLWLTFRRFYNNQSYVSSTSVGAQWRHSFDRSLAFTPPGFPIQQITLFRPDGSREVFTKTNGSWLADVGIWDTLTEQDDSSGRATGYTLFMAVPRDTEHYSPDGVLSSITDASGLNTTLRYGAVANVSTTSNRLLAVTDPYGRSLSFAYDTNARLATVTAPDGGVLTYAYDDQGRLSSVTYPGGSKRQYLYNEAGMTNFANGVGLPNALTALIDEQGVRFEETKYDAYGRATYSGFAGGVDATTISYSSTAMPGPVTVVLPSGGSTKLGFQTVGGFVRVASSSQACGSSCNQPWLSVTYDAKGAPTSLTDFNKNITGITTNSVGLETQRIEAKGSAIQRTIDTTWNTTQRLPLVRTVKDAAGNLVAKSGWSYNARGQVLAECAMDPAISGAVSYTCGSAMQAPVGVRQWRSTYCDAVSTNCPLVGLRLTVAGPRADLAQTTDYRYYSGSAKTGCGTPGGACYQPGDLYQIVDVLGHVTTIASYDGAGRVTRMTDANGVTSDTTYTSRGWLASRSIGGATTQYTYTPYGAVASITDADGVKLTYTYDGAHRLSDVADAQGNHIHYTLDAAGHRIKEDILDSSGSLRRTIARNYNTLGQLTQQKDGLGQAIFSAGYTDSYDGNGNLVHTGDALGIQRRQTYDGLDRLVGTIDNLSGADTATQNTQSVAAYDANDSLAGFSDPNGLNTLYSYNGLGDLTAISSPDTGGASYTYDAAGSRLSATDAKGVKRTYAYDALNRLKSVSYADTKLNVSYAYDEANGTTGCVSSYPVGRLTRVVEAAVVTVYCYDAHGNVVEKRQTIGTATDITRYAYTPGDRLKSITTPSSLTVQYTRDTSGHITIVTLTPPSGTATTAVSNVSYLPFGPVLRYTLGNGQTVTRTYDANYALTDISSTAFNWHVARNAMGQITAQGNAAGANPATETYSYDPLYRLASVKDASGKAIETYTYNKTGDRLSKTASGLASGTYSYKTATHWLISVGNAARTYDANGNTVSNVMGSETYGYDYDGRNRLITVQRNGSTVGTYTYNAQGERVAKVATLPSASNQRYAYDQANQLLGEYGSSTKDYVWLDTLPVAVVDTQGTTSMSRYVVADGLNTPRAIADSTGKTVWQWSVTGNPFGEQPPTSSTGYVYNLRYPGQYYDAESGLNYNVNRYYEPATGRYIQSDPIGLAGGLSTYAYAANTPINASDSSGLACNAHGCWNTPEEEAYGIAGDWNNYYRTACANGDPYACRGSQVAHNSDAPGIRGPLTHITNIKLEASLRRNLPGLPCDIASQIVDQEMENIREGLVKARVQQLDGADEDHPRMVSKQSISDFHHQVFQANGASPDAFGGDLWDAFYGPVWSGWLGDRYEWCESPACMHK